MSLTDVAAWPKVAFEKFGPIDRQALSRIRRRAASRLLRNWVMIPHVTHHEWADISELERRRSELNAHREEGDAKLTMLAFVVVACAIALEEFPQFNASLDPDEEELVLRRYCNIGIATETPAGLVVPVLRDLWGMGARAIAGQISELAGVARDGKLTPAQMAGGTFTISSLGGIGGRGFTPIINAPEVAILGLTRAETTPVWDGEAFAPRLMLPMSLSYDHRVIDGADAARFTVRLAELMSQTLPGDLDARL